MERIRAIRQQNVADGQPVRRRVRQAQHALDQAIYSDQVNEAEVERLARELADAQAAEVRLRAMTELSIRRVLTPEQLNTFRTIRQQRRRALAERRLDNPNAPPPLRNRRLRNVFNSQPPAGGAGTERAETPGQLNRKGAPLLSPRERRQLRRIRP